MDTGNTYGDSGTNGDSTPVISGRQRNPLRTWGRCARNRWFDWCLFLVCMGLLVLTERITGAHMHLSTFQIQQVKNPFHPSTVPSWSVPVYSLLGPPFVITLVTVAHGYTADHHHTALLCSWVATVGAALVTNVLKLTVGRPRPNFYYRCWPDGHEVYTQINDFGLREPDCRGAHDPQDEIDGYKSFPSGHTSWSFASMGFISLYLLCFMRRNGGVHSLLDLAIIWLPVLIASWVGATRVIDYYHNASDVAVGALIGIAILLSVFYVSFSRTILSLCGFGAIPESPIAPSSQLDLLQPPNRAHFPRRGSAPTTSQSMPASRQAYEAEMLPV